RRHHCNRRNDSHWWGQHRRCVHGGRPPLASDPERGSVHLPASKLSTGRLLALRLPDRPPDRVRLSRGLRGAPAAARRLQRLWTTALRVCDRSRFRRREDRRVGVPTLVLSRYWVSRGAALSALLFAWA